MSVCPPYYHSAYVMLRALSALTGASPISLLFLILPLLAAPAAAQSTTAWQTLAPMLISRSDFQVQAYNSVFYIHGGCVGNQTVNGGCPLITNRLESYNTLTNQWAELTPSPTNRTQYSAARVGSRIYYIGGRDLNSNVVSTVDVLDASTLTWSTLPPQAGVTDRSNAAAFVLGSTIYVSGGYDVDYNSLNSTITLNTATSPLLFSSSTVPAKPTSAGDCGGVAIDGYGYVFAGFSSTEADGNGFCHPLSTLERYSPTNNSWTQMAPILTARGDPAYAVVNGLLFLMGGEGKLNPTLYCYAGNDLSVPINDVEYYSPTTNTWTYLDTLPVSRFRFSGGVGGPNNATIYNIGGQAGEVITNATANPDDPNVDSGYWPVVNLVEGRDVSGVSNGVRRVAAEWGWGMLVMVVVGMLVA